MEQPETVSERFIGSWITKAGGVVAILVLFLDYRGVGVSPPLAAVCLGLLALYALAVVWKRPWPKWAKAVLMLVVIPAATLALWRATDQSESPTGLDRDIVRTSGLVTRYIQPYGNILVCRVVIDGRLLEEFADTHVVVSFCGIDDGVRDRLLDQDVGVSRITPIASGEIEMIAPITQAMGQTVAQASAQSSVTIWFDVVMLPAGTATKGPFFDVADALLVGGVGLKSIPSLQLSRRR